MNKKLKAGFVGFDDFVWCEATPEEVADPDRYTFEHHTRKGEMDCLYPNPARQAVEEIERRRDSVEEDLGIELVTKVLTIYEPGNPRTQSRRSLAEINELITDGVEVILAFGIGANRDPAATEASPWVLRNGSTGVTLEHLPQNRTMQEVMSGPPVAIVPEDPYAAKIAVSKLAYSVLNEARRTLDFPPFEDLHVDPDTKFSAGVHSCNAAGYTLARAEGVTGLFGHIAPHVSTEAARDLFSRRPAELIGLTKKGSRPEEMPYMSTDRTVEISIEVLRAMIKYHRGEL